jgi:hypothetical protein
MIRYPTRLPSGLQILDGLKVRKTARCSMEHTFRFMDALINHFIRQPDPTVVPVYQFLNLSTASRFEYSYDMDLLGMLSDDEKMLVSHYGSLQDRHGRSAYMHSAMINKEREYPHLFSFLKELTIQGRYYDLHGGNIMIDLEGNYRVIDLEGFHYRNLSHQDNNWITR